MLNIRLAEPTDLAAIAAFDAFPGDRIIEIVERRMLVIDIDGRAQGYTSWQKNGCIGKDYVNKLVVSEACRGKGLAKQLIAALNTVLVGRVFISTPANNIAAVGLLDATSWVPAGEIVGLLPLGEAEVFFYKDLWPEQAS
ncbi:hypothetical protein HMP09_p0042 (plasmid) [Sphingomonas sp. HMP9]|uniref:GNAT family N-acetyltransferase n=1 Tax=Sphingomonas sp. HMP9 TaxID=1517554 RepID=UPI00159659D9|nr:GNAT family N-acetyltransferase [Sphingomonas sp. HMP9]BCA64394.1 hypothetical protein HMP09_p0042 [Sphingomonas sp. HMP9]